MARVQSWQKQHGVDAAVWSVLSELSKKEEAKNSTKAVITARHWVVMNRSDWLTLNVTNCMFVQSPSTFFFIAWASAFQMFSLGYNAAGHVKRIS